jgi:UDP-glucose 4-epimerase
MNSRVLLTGVSSFTGYWFAKVLSEYGYSICCPLPREERQYEGLKKERLDSLPQEVEVVYDSPFGSSGFLGLLDSRIDALCLHGSYVSGYNQSDFSASEAIRQNLYNAEAVLAKAKTSGCSRVIWTSSVFEDAVELDDSKLGTYPVWYRYALSKKLSGLAFRSLCFESDIGFSRFVITNPFGPLEDPKLCRLMANAVIQQKVFEVRTPHYVRDMIHVRHLAEAYIHLLRLLISGQDCPELRPGEYSGNLGDFAQIFVSEISKRLGKPCRVERSDSMVFNEPLSLINETHVSSLVKVYDPNDRWDELAAFYSCN